MFVFVSASQSEKCCNRTRLRGGPRRVSIDPKTSPGSYETLKSEQRNPVQSITHEYYEYVDSEQWNCSPSPRAEQQSVSSALTPRFTKRESSLVSMRLRIIGVFIQSMVESSQPSLGKYEHNSSTTCSCL